MIPRFVEFQLVIFKNTNLKSDQLNNTIQNYFHFILSDQQFACLKISNSDIGVRVKLEWKIKKTMLFSQIKTMSILVGKRILHHSFRKYIHAQII